MSKLTSSTISALLAAFLTIRLSNITIFNIYFRFPSCCLPNLIIPAVPITKPYTNSLLPLNLFLMYIAYLIFNCYLVFIAATKEGGPGKVVFGAVSYLALYSPLSDPYLLLSICFHSLPRLDYLIPVFSSDFKEGGPGKVVFGAVSYLALCSPLPDT